jgi:hypothetical protein
MKKILAAILVSAAASFASQANAAKVFFKSPVKFVGTGCKPGSYSFSDQGADTLTVQFNAYDAAQPTKNAASKMRRTSCSFVVPVNVPTGYQVIALTVDWRGYAEGNVELYREYFLTGPQGPRRKTKTQGHFKERDNLMHNVWSRCGAGVVPIRINSSVRAKSKPSYIGMDPLGFVEQSLIFHLKWRKCP